MVAPIVGIIVDNPRSLLISLQVEEMISSRANADKALEQECRESIATLALEESNKNVQPWCGDVVFKNPDGTEQQARTTKLHTLG